MEEQNWKAAIIDKITLDKSQQMNKKKENQQKKDTEDE